MKVAARNPAKEGDMQPMPEGGWGEIKPTDPPKRKIPAVRRGHRRRGRVYGQHIFQMNEADRHVARAISQAGARPQDRL